MKRQQGKGAAPAAHHFAAFLAAPRPAAAVAAPAPAAPVAAVAAIAAAALPLLSLHYTRPLPRRGSWGHRQSPFQHRVLHMLLGAAAAAAAAANLEDVQLPSGRVAAAAAAR